MKIGFVSTWFERGAAYVTKQYAELLKKHNHEISIYARGESYAIGNPKWDTPNVTWGKKLYDTTLDINDVSKWIEKNGIECIFFNEQRDMVSVLKIREKYPHVKLGTYIDYYTQGTVEDFDYYDFLICNTKRHYSVFSKHKQCFYVPWGTDIELFKPIPNDKDRLTFFHSAGMSTRKGTDVLIRAFIKGKVYEKADLVVHTQIPISELTEYKEAELADYNITVIQKTVTAPGLYYLGDVYVYPTTLDGLGLTMYEALACGLPVIATDCAPMNEVVNDGVGRLIKVDSFKCRWDAYYWPLAFVEEQSLVECMMYYVDNYDKIDSLKRLARESAEKNWNWFERGEQVNNAFENSVVLDWDMPRIKDAIAKYKSKDKKSLIKALIPFLPHWVQQVYFRNR